MIKLPKFDNQSMYDYETYFNLTMNDERLGKFLAHYEAMKIAENIPGEIVECGVFKGTSFARFAIMRRVMGGEKSAKIFGFDAKLKLNPSVNHGHSKKQNIQEEITEKNVKCPVWCVNVPSEVFYVRRNGKTCCRNRI